MKPTREQLLDLLKVVASTEAREIDCEEFLTRVGAFLESVERSSELSTELGQVSQHLEICSECREEFDALVELHR